MRRNTAREDGFTIVEVVIAAMVVAAGAFATFGVLASAIRNAERTKASQVALDRAQQELEALRSLHNDELALTAAPAHSPDALNPNFRVSNGTFALTREPPGSYANLVVNGGSLYGGGFVEGGVVNPGPVSFSSGDVSGEVYRYIVWRNDPSCPESTCPGTQDFKQIVVAVKLDTPPNQSGERGYVELQSNFIDPKDSALGDPVPGAEGVVTAQQFFLSDTPCSAAGSTPRQAIAGDHPLHNTLGTCASGLQTGSTLGAPDALLLGAPPDPTPEVVEDPPAYDYSVDYPSQPTPATAKGIQLRRDDTSGCHYQPTGVTGPQWQVHRWVTDPMPSTLPEGFKMSGKVTLDFFTRALNDSLYRGKLCLYLFRRHETGSPPEAVDTLFVNKSSGTPYWTYTPPGAGYWWREGWQEVRLPLEFASNQKIAAGDRLGLALSLERAGTGDDAVAIMYDNPEFKSRIEVDTTTPLDGG